MSNTSTRNNSTTTTFPEITPEDITLLRRIKKSVDSGHDVEIKKAPDGKLKVLEVSKKYISVE